MKLSLVMMVRDEASVLPAFFRNHLHLADEIIVVDTGSLDDTPAIAADAGARVLSCPWADDFSSPRNQGLRAATGDWALVLDADEEIATGDFDRLRSFLGSAPPGVFIQPTINYCDDAGHLEWQPVSGQYPVQERGHRGYFAARRAGLFPVTAELRFRGRIHESVLPAALDAGLPVTEIDLPVHHYGYVRSTEINRKRQERYLDLARRKLGDDPEDWGARLELATAYLENGDPVSAEPLLIDLSGGPAGLRPVVRGCFLLGRIRRERGELDSAEKVLQMAIDQDPTFVFCWLELIRCRAARGMWASVDELLGRARKSCGSEHALLAKESLRCMIHTGRLREGAQQARQLVELYPAWAEMRTLAERLTARES